jgi:hypothetical protein
MKHTEGKWEVSGSESTTAIWVQAENAKEAYSHIKITKGSTTYLRQETATGRHKGFIREW